MTPTPAPAAGPAAAPAAAPPRRRLAWLRVSRFEIWIAVALVLAAALPLVAALWLATGLADLNLDLGLNPRVVDRLQSIPSLYGDLFRALKQLYTADARAIARDLPGDPRAARAYLGRAVARVPRLLRATWVAPDGRALAEAEHAPGTGDVPGDGEYREAPIRVPLAGGGALECVFAVEAHYFAESDEARELGEQVTRLDQLRAQIRESYLRSFGTALVAAVVLAAALGIAVARRTTRRVTALVGAVHRLAAGDLAVQVDPGRSSDEVAGLARAFNAMVREVKESRDRIVYLEKISGWQEVARRLAHEIKNPLTPILLAFQQLEARWRARGADEPGDPAFGRLLGEAGDIVREEVGTLQRLVEDFSSFAKLPEVRAEPADLAEFVDEFVRTSPQLAESADVEVSPGAGAVPAAIDRALMRRVLSNLAENAIQAARPARARLHLGVARARDRAVLTVADEGPGIDPELRERIFDPYFTTKSDGTGLGLAIVKKLVLQHGGEIQAGERPGGGASFTIALPLRPA